ncbi:MAG: hypothetical protein JW709_04180, partial [Sedimentisphaerales bacterium]|nr:hypothetical protein [Sedimentisphaerales bacterium]
MKRGVLQIMLVLIAVGVIASVAQGELLIHWAFNESAGATQAADSGPTGSYTAVNGGGTPTFGQTGIAGNAVRFDGVDDWLQLPYTTDVVNASFTLSFWINEDGASTAHMMPLTFGSTYPEYPNGSMHVESGWQMFHRNDSTLNLRLGGIRDWAPQFDMAKGYFIGNTTTLTRNTGWHHLVVTVETTGVTEDYDGYTYYRVNRANYLDGQRIVQVGGLPEDNILFLPGPTQLVPLSIGCRVQDMDGTTPIVSYPYQGMIDDIQYYTHALDAGAVGYLYNNPGTSLN